MAGQMIGLFKGFENKLVAKALVSFGSTIQIPESEADIARCCHCKSPGKINGILKIGAEIPGMHGDWHQSCAGTEKFERVLFRPEAAVFFREEALHWWLD